MRLKRQHKGIVFLFLIAAILLALAISFYVYLRADSVRGKLKTDPIIKSLILLEDNGKVILSDVFLAYAESGAPAF